MKIEYKCAYCGKPIQRYPSQVKNNAAVYCSRRCLGLARPKIKHPHLSEYNREHNCERMTQDVREKLRNSLLNTGKNKSYRKLYGRHEHRAIAEKILGRALLPGEVVHHIDENKRNNAPENLMVFKNQAEHAKWHAEHRKEVRPS